MLTSIESLDINKLAELEQKIALWRRSILGYFPLTGQEILFVYTHIITLGWTTAACSC